MRIICTSYKNGKCHDYRLFKESKVKIHPEIKVAVDTGYHGLQKIHAQTVIPKKRSKKQSFSQSDKAVSFTMGRYRKIIKHRDAKAQRHRVGATCHL